MSDFKDEPGAKDALQAAFNEHAQADTGLLQKLFAKNSNLTRLLQDVGTFKGTGFRFTVKQETSPATQAGGVYTPPVHTALLSFEPRKLLIAWETRQTLKIALDVNGVFNREITASGEKGDTYLPTTAVSNTVVNDVKEWVKSVGALSSSASYDQDWSRHVSSHASKPEGKPV